MPSHESGADLEVLLLRGFARPQDAFDAARVGGEVLFHEHVDALLHGILQMGRAEGGMGSQHRHVARPQTINGVPIGVEAQEPPLRRNVDPVAQRLLQGIVGLVDLLLADIRHGDQLDRTARARANGPFRAAVVSEDQSARRHGIGHCAAAPAAAADQGQMDGVVLRGMNVGNRHACQRRDGGELASGFDEFATGGKLFLPNLHVRYAGWRGAFVSTLNQSQVGMRLAGKSRCFRAPDAVGCGRMKRVTLNHIILGSNRFSGLAPKIHGVLFGLFLVQFILVWSRLWLPWPLLGNARWPDGLLVVLTTATVLASLACELPGQNVMLASIIIAFIAGAVQTLGALTAMPFGPYVYTDYIGQQLFYPLPWAVPMVWIAFLLSSRGVARLMLRPWRNSPSYGFKLIGLTALLVVLLDVGLEPFARRVKHYWFWNPTKLRLEWYSTPGVNFMGWAITALLILAFATPA